MSPLDPTNASAEVFISYGSADAPQVEVIARELRTAGISLWRDGDQLLGGVSYNEKIVSAIKHSKVVVLMCSPHSLASDNVHQEIMVTWDAAHRQILPLWLTPPLRACDIPNRFQYCLASKHHVVVLDRPSKEWLPRVLSALASFGVRPAAPVADLGSAGMSTGWRDRVLSFARKFGKPAGFVANVALQTLVPGAPFLAEVAEKILEIAGEGSQASSDDEILQAVQANGSDVQEVVRMLDVLQDGMSELLHRIASLEKQPERAKQLLLLARSTDANLRGVQVKLNAFTFRFDRIENQNDRILEGQEQMLSMMVDMAAGGAAHAPPMVQMRAPSPTASGAVGAPNTEKALEVIMVWEEFTAQIPAETRARYRQILSCVKARLLAPGFRVAIVGRWRQGKTLLINRLVGGHALPVGLIHPVAMKTAIRWATRPTARLYFSPYAQFVALNEWPEDIVSHRDAAKDGPVPPLDLSPDRLAECPPPEPDQAYLPVEKLEVFWPAEVLLDGVELLDTPGTDVAHLVDGWGDALDAADFVVYVINAANSGLRPQDITFLAREVRCRGHEFFALALTGSDNLSRCSTTRWAVHHRRTNVIDESLFQSSLAIVRDTTATSAGLPPTWVFSLGLQEMAVNTREELQRLSVLIRNAAAARCAFKARSALLRLRSEAGMAFGPRPTAPQQAFADRVGRLLEDFSAIKLNEDRQK